METPRHPDDLTVDWLSATLRARGVLQHARVTALTIDDLGATKGTTGQLARVCLAYDTAEPAAPRSLIAKCSAADPQTRALVHSIGFYEREVRFYEQLAARSPLRTPRCYFSAIDLATGTSLLLLEDLTAARNGNWIAGCSVADAELAIRSLAPFHAAWWRDTELEHLPWLQLRGLTAVDQVPAFFHQTWAPFLAKLGPHVTPELLQIGAWLETHLGRLSTDLYQAPPYTLIHNDFQADNLFFAGTGPSQTLVVADWQLTTRGRGVIDVACFLGGNLEPGDRQQHELRLLHDYHTLLLEHGVREYSFERCLDEYRRALLQGFARLASVIGLGVVPAQQEGGYCEVLVPRYCRALHDLNVGETLRIDH